MKKQHINRLLSLVIILVMCLGMVVPAGAAGVPGSNGWIVEKVDNSAVSAQLSNRTEMKETANDTPDYKDTDIVRVSVVLEEKSTLEMAQQAGISTQGIANNAEAMGYREKLVENQAAVAKVISRRALNGKPLDVVWNLTLAANIISANVEYGQIDEIAQVPGVAEVVIETCYQPDVVEAGGDDPNMATSSAQIGSTVAYQGGYTGAGSRIAIIDTGTDISHQSFDNGAFLYALEQNAIAAGMDFEEYVASLDLLDAEEIAEVFGELNISVYAGLDPAWLYGNEKLAFNFNYIDVNLNVTHLYDQQGEHGSHVAGIATANRYIPDGEGGYVSALDSVFVQGVAPDAQLLTMKVFGADGGAYDSDYMAAIEDAIILGADSINLSLGSGNPGMTYSSTYQDIMDMLSGTDTVVVMSAGNSGGWADSSYYSVNYGLPYLFADDVSYHTGGSPGTFTNSLGVASVENSGFTALYIDINGSRIDYLETYDYSNAPMVTLAGEQEYVFVNGIGTPEDFAAVDVEGKIAICYRGETSFFEKANAAVEAGAIGVIIVNNTSGGILLNLTGYNYTAPVISLTMANGELFKTNPVVGEDGSALYWTGTMNISDKMGTGSLGSEYYTMSGFSSWGVPGDLSMKPEITAPGGNIYSVFGTTPFGGGIDQYELMSGTSMAAPQVTGMMAVLMQYIRENDLSVEGMTDRALAQSLLMSTAKPIIDGNSGNYYPVLQQGAGLANVGAATLAKSYILMGANATDSAADGKVKVELGDDPAKNGSYTFSFTINNMYGEDVAYTLSADFFTQDLYSGFLDTWTTDLGADVTWLVEGAELESDIDNLHLDFNGDGCMNTDDGQALLDFATGKVSDIDNRDYADLNGDGAVSSYDAYLFLTLLESSVVEVPAYGSVSVTVNVELNDEKLASYPVGAYVEGYVFVDALATEEGVLGESHSIPVLGFYGNWTDASMYDYNGYLYHLHGGYTNMLTVKYAGDSNEYVFGGNPVVEDEYYMPERNAISAANGDVLNSLTFTSIRNAGNAMFVLGNAMTGDMYMANQLGAVNGAYFHVNNQAWRNVTQALNLSSLPLAQLPEDQLLYASLVLAPELYANADGSYNWNALGDGAWLTEMFTIDNTAPALVGSDVYTIDDDTMTMTVSVQDNQYVAGVALFDQTGQYLYTYEGSKAEAQAGDTVEYVLDLTDVNGAEFLLQVYDYASNVTTYRISRVIGTVTDEVTGVMMSQTAAVLTKGSTLQLTAFVTPVNATNRDVTWYSTDPSVVTVDENGLVTAVGYGDAIIAAFADGDPTGSIYGACQVSVLAVDYTVNGVLQDAEGAPMSFTWNFAEDETWSKVSDLPMYIGAAAGAGDNVYVIASDTLATYAVDPATGEVLAAGVSDMPYWDMTANKVFAGTVSTIYGGYFIPTQNPLNIQAYAYNLSNPLANYTGASYFVGVESAGLYYDEWEGCYAELFYALDNMGYVWMFELTVNGDFYLFNYYETDLMAQGAQFNLDYDFAYSSLVAAEDGALFLSDFDGTTNHIYMLAPVLNEYGSVASYAAMYLGNVGRDVWPAVITSVVSNGTSGTESALNSVAPNAELMKTEVVAEEIASAGANGGLNSVANYVAPVNPRSAATPENDQSTVVLNTTAQNDEGVEVYSTNGVQYIYYNAEDLTLDSVVVHGDYESVIVDEENGMVIIGYVSLAGIPAGQPVATLTFTVDNICDHVFSVQTVEVNELFVNLIEEVELTHEHVYGDWYVYREVTVLEAGEERRDCAYCHHYESRLIPVMEVPSPVFPIIPVPGQPELPSVDPDQPDQPGEPIIFTDVKEGSWYKAAVDYVTANGIMVGTSEDEFNPAGLATRAMVWTMLARLDGVEVTGESAPWYAEALAWVTENGVSDGTMPNEHITREQIVTMLWRNAGSPEYSYDLSAYTDADQISDWARTAMEWAVGNGIIKGVSDTELDPKGDATRAQLAQIFMNMDGKF